MSWEASWIHGNHNSKHNKRHGKRPSADLREEQRAAARPSALVEAVPAFETDAEMTGTASDESAAAGWRQRKVVAAVRSMHAAFEEAQEAAVAREPIGEVAAEEADALLGLGVAAMANMAGADKANPSSTRQDYRPDEARAAEGAHVEL